MTSQPPRGSISQGLRTVGVGLAVNFSLTCVKLAAGILGNCYVLIADAVESAADVFSSVLVWWGLRIAAKPPDADHPYGHGKAEPLTAMAVGVALALAGIGIAIQSVREIITPHHAPAPFTLIVLVAVVIVKELLYRFAFRVGETLHSNAVKGDAWHHRSDAITSAAAFVGISVALLGGRGYESADDWAAIFASVIILVNAVRLFRAALPELMDASPSADVEVNVRETAAHVEGVVGLDKCFVRKMGFEYYVDLHVVVDGNLTVYRGHEIAHQVRDAIHRSNPSISSVLVHIEPAQIV